MLMLSMGVCDKEIKKQTNDETKKIKINKKTNKQTNKGTNKQTKEQTNKWTNEQSRWVAMVYWLRQMAHDWKAVGLNPGAIY